MSYPTQEQPNEAAPLTRPVAADSNQPYPGVPEQPHTAQQYVTAPFATAPEAAQTNRLATAGLILGILPTGIIGIVVSVLGLNRAGKIGGVGRGRALAGLILSIVWTLVIILVIALAAAGTSSKAVERLNPACVSAENFGKTYESKTKSDAGNLSALQADLQSAVTEFSKDADRSTNSAAATAMRNEAKDIQTFLGDIDNNTRPDQTLITKISTDGQAINTACGH